MKKHTSNILRRGLAVCLSAAMLVSVFTQPALTVQASETTESYTLEESSTAEESTTVAESTSAEETTTAGESTAAEETTTAGESTAAEETTTAGESTTTEETSAEESSTVEETTTTEETSAEEATTAGESASAEETPTQESTTAEESSSEETITSEIETYSGTTDPRYKMTWSVQNVNYFVDGETFLVCSYKARELTTSQPFENDNYFGKEEGNTSPTLRKSAANSFKAIIKDEPADNFTNYTAFVIEFLGTSKTNVTEFDAVEYFVDAVIDGSKKSDVDMADLQAKTEYGFVLYIPTDQLDSENTPSRGDLVDPDFWHIYYQLGTSYTDLPNSVSHLGNLVFYENPTEVIPTVAPANINATVKLFNYNETINAIGAGQVDPDNDGDFEDGFVFWSGWWGYGGNIETVDGEGQENSTNDKGLYRYPTMANTLDSDGYPQLSAGVNLISLAYLYNGASIVETDSTTSPLVATMNNGGGLFQKGEDGYYYYDSLLNAAYYNSDKNQFELYKDLIVRPWYHTTAGDDIYEDKSTTPSTWKYYSAGGPLEAYGNFLPFNQITTDNITIDGSVNKTVDSSVTYPAGSLENVGLTSAVADGVLAGTKALSSELKSQINSRRLSDSTITTARLEETLDMWFGMTVDFEFYMPKDGKVNNDAMTFDFHGDDDVFVYIGVWNEEAKAYDYKLVLDIGGVHGARSGSINFATGAVIDAPATDKNNNHSDENDYVPRTTSLQEIFNLNGSTFEDYTKLSLKFFYLERGGNISYCRLRFNIPTLPENSLTVTKELTEEATIAEGQDITDYIEESYTYQFRVVNAANPSESFFKDGTTYNILENGVIVGNGTLDAEGIFELKANQSAQFEKVLENRAHDDVSQYIVQEIIPSDLTGQYKGVAYIIGSAGGFVVTGTEESEFTKYSTGSLTADQTQNVVFRNAVDYEKLSTLTITKMLTEDAQESLANHEFRIQVTLDGELLPYGTTYTVTEGEITSSDTVDQPGIIWMKAGQTVTIPGILSGCTYTVTELDTTTGPFQPTYTGTVANGSVSCDKSGATGEFPLNSTVAITVTNDLKDGDLQVDKTVEATDKEDEFVLTLEAFATGHVESISNGPKDIVLVLDQSASMFSPAGAANYYDNSDLHNLSNLSPTISVDELNENTDKATHLGYYVAQSTSGRPVGADNKTYYDWFIVQYYDGKWYHVRTNHTAEAVNINLEEDLWHSTNNPTTNQIGETVVWNTPNNNFRYYKSQYGALYDAVSSFVNGINATGVNHRIAIVGFASPYYDAFDHLDGTGIYLDGEYYLYDTDYAYEDEQGYYDPDIYYAVDTDGQKQYIDANTLNFKNVSDVYDQALVDITSNGGHENIMKSVNAIVSNYRQTCPAAGLDITNNIFKKTHNVDADGTVRDRMVILFTDGHPTVTTGANYDNAYDNLKYEYWSESGGKNEAIQIAKELKDIGVEIYTIGTSAVRSNTRDFLNGVSSDYPNATGYPVVNDHYSLTNQEKPTQEAIDKLLGASIESPRYTTYVESDAALQEIFSNIMSTATATTVNLDGTAVLKEVLSTYFDLNAVSTSDIEVYTADYLGNGEFADPVIFEDAAVSFSSSAGENGRLDTVNVSNFSYKDNLVMEAYTDENGVE